MGEAFHRGRLIDHLNLMVDDLATARRFYEAALGVLAIPVGGAGPGYFWFDEIWVEEKPGHPRQHLHLAFQACDRETVQRFHAATLAAGGRDNGGPGERDYHPGYYGAFVFDPDGNNIEAVYHGPAERSADSVMLTRKS